MKETTKSIAKISPIFKLSSFSWYILLTAFVLTIIENFLKMPLLVGSWHIVSYLLLLAPLIYLSIKKRVKNRFTKYFIFAILILIFDTFYYNNSFVQIFVPIAIYLLIILLYLSSMHSIKNIYKTLIPSTSMPIFTLNYLKDFIDNIFTLKKDKAIYKRIILGVLATLPFVLIFTLLFTSADSLYSKFLSTIFTNNFNFSFSYLFSVPLYFTLYLSIFVYGLSNSTNSSSLSISKKIDSLIIGILLWSLNLLFLSFVALKIPFLLEGSLPKSINIANFAREGFFELMLVMAIVSAIFLFIFRYDNSKKINFLLALLLFQTIIIGIVSLKKIYLYHNLMGATVLRNYVEWFDYFLILILLFAILSTLKGFKYSTFLNFLIALATISFVAISSVNIDALVAKENILKFKNNPNKLDKKMLQELSIDALPVIKKYNIKLNYKNYFSNLRDCSSFKSYHLGYCLKSR